MRLASLDGVPVARAEGERGPWRSLAGLVGSRGGSGPGLDAVIESWAQLGPTIVAELDDQTPVEAAGVWGPPLSRPGKIVGAPVNYLDHGAEMAMTHTVEELGFFLKAPSSVIGPGGSVVLPDPTVRTDQEAELAVVISRRARRVSPELALSHVLGYTCLLDITQRGSQERSMRKSYDTFTPMGPWITTTDEIPDPGVLSLRCWVDGLLRQDATTADLIVGVPELVARISAVMTLEPGDVIATGTPAGVGPLAPGQRVAVEIQGLGRLEVDVTGAGQ